MKNKNIAFTLAEVLITIGIIGVVAAMTMPSLIQKHKEQEYITKLKKFNSIMDQAIKMAVSQNGEIEEWGLTEWRGANSDSTDEEIAEGYRSRNLFWSYVLPQLQILSYCEYGTTCNESKWSRKSLDGTSFGSFNPVVNLVDGTTIVASTIYSGSCSSNIGGGALAHTCGELFVDLNGRRPPNATGKDVFLFYVTKFGVLPMGSQEEKSNSFTFKNYCNMDKPGKLNGYGCAAWVIYNGNMDYLHCNNLDWATKTKCK